MISDEEYLFLTKKVEKLESLIFPYIQNRLEDNVLQGLIHDINNKFLKLSGVLHELKNNTPFRGHIKNKVEEVTKSMEDEMLVIQFLLESIAIKNSNKKEFVDLGRLIRFVINSMRLDRRNIEFRFEKSNTPNLFINRSKLFLVVYELLKNSIDAIFARKKNIKNNLIIIKSDLIEKYYEISFEDNGVGISNQEVEKITTLGFTTKEEGGGLGLAFVKDFIQNEMNGELIISSKIGKGTNITVKIPEYMNYVD